MLLIVCSYTVCAVHDIKGFILNPETSDSQIFIKHTYKLACTVASIPNRKVKGESEKYYVLVLYTVTPIFATQQLHKTT